MRWPPWRRRSSEEEESESAAARARLSSLLVEARSLTEQIEANVTRGAGHGR